MYCAEQDKGTENERPFLRHSVECCQSLGDEPAAEGRKWEPIPSKF